MLLSNITLICLTGPIIHKVKDVEPLKKMAKQQSSAITAFNKLLGCDSRDTFKVAYDQRQLDIAAGATDLPPLKQI
jgi:hypothetical protein